MKQKSYLPSGLSIIKEEDELSIIEKILDDELRNFNIEKDG
jgi:hypothetical protein